MVMIPSLFVSSFRRSASEAMSVASTPVVLSLGAAACTESAGMITAIAQTIIAIATMAASRRLLLLVLFIIAFIGTHDESFLNGVNTDFETMFHKMIDGTDIGNREKSQ